MDSLLDELDLVSELVYLLGSKYSTSLTSIVAMVAIHPTLALS